MSFKPSKKAYRHNSLTHLIMKSNEAEQKKILNYIQTQLKHIYKRINKENIVWN